MMIVFLTKDSEPHSSFSTSIQHTQLQSPSATIASPREYIWANLGMLGWKPGHGDQCLYQLPQQHQSRWSWLSDPSTTSHFYVRIIKKRTTRPQHRLRGMWRLSLVIHDVSLSVCSRNEKNSSMKCKMIVFSLLHLQKLPTILLFSIDSQFRFVLLHASPALRFSQRQQLTIMGFEEPCNLAQWIPQPNQREASLESQHVLASLPSFILLFTVQPNFGR